MRRTPLFAAVGRLSRLSYRVEPGTLLCDSGLRYQARLLNRECLESKRMTIPDWLVAKPNYRPANTASNFSRK